MYFTNSREKIIVTSFLLLVFVSILILTSFTLEYLEVYRAFKEIKASIEKVYLKVNSSDSLTEALLKIKIKISNPTNSQLLIQSIYIDPSKGIYLNNERLFYISHSRISPQTVIGAKEEKEFSLTITVKGADNPDLDKIEEAMREERFEWFFFIRSWIKVSFKQGLIDLSSPYSGVYLGKS